MFLLWISLKVKIALCFFNQFNWPGSPYVVSAKNNDVVYACDFSSCCVRMFEINFLYSCQRMRIHYVIFTLSWRSIYSNIRENNQIIKEKLTKAFDHVKIKQFDFRIKAKYTNIQIYKMIEIQFVLVMIIWQKQEQDRETYFFLYFGQNITYFILFQYRKAVLSTL